MASTDARASDQSRLADTRVANDCHQLAVRNGHDPLPRAADERDLRCAPDEACRVLALGRLVDARPIGGYRFGLSFQGQRRDGLYLRGATSEGERWLPDQHFAGLGSLLEPSGDVHRIAGGQPLGRPGHHLAGCDANPPLEAKPRKRIAHLDSGPQCTERVIFVDGGHAEDSHDRVTDELLDAPAVPLDYAAHPLEVAGEKGRQPLRVEASRPWRSSR